MKTDELISLLPDRVEMERAFASKDASYDGVFYIAVKTTGVFCRPSCPSRPQASNVEYFPSIKESVAAGYRPCKRCHPLEATGRPPEWVRALMARVQAAPDACIRARDLQALGVTPERARRWFKEHYGMTFAAWCRGNRLATAFRRMRKGDALDDAILDSGFESHSGFRDAFARVFGDAPGRSRRDGGHIAATVLETPFGPVVAGASDRGVALLQYNDGRQLKKTLEDIAGRFDCAVVPAKHDLLEQLGSELGEYFGGTRREFSVPLELRGTPFQEKVWYELQTIPYGQTISYDELARRIGQPNATRAVANANRVNCVCILIPCHRVIGKDGTLTGYGGGLWRKRLLLELEQRNAHLAESPRAGVQTSLRANSYRQLPATHT